MLLLKGTRSLEFVPVSVVPVAAVPGRMCCGPERQEIICCVRHSWSSTLAQECDCQVVLTHGSISQDTFHCSDMPFAEVGHDRLLLFFAAFLLPVFSHTLCNHLLRLFCLVKFDTGRLSFFHSLFGLRQFILFGHVRPLWGRNLRGD